MANRFISKHEPTVESCKDLIDVLQRVGDKWTIRAIGALAHGSQRYNEIQKACDGISQRMLTLTLKDLERDGFVKRTVFPTIPPRVDYELTELGFSLLQPLAILHDWTVENMPRILESRDVFQSRPKGNRDPR